MGEESIAMKIWAIIPVKPFNRAKSRLAKVLSPEQRISLAEKMFRHSLEVMISVQRIGGVLVVSRDSKALNIARSYNVQTVQESGTPELNPALLRASQVVNTLGGEGVLVLPADLPLVNAEDIEQMLHLGRYNATVVLAPDRYDNGTNALLVSPPGLIPFSFGPSSFQRHVMLAEEANATVKVYRSERLALDIDTPDDLTAYEALTSERLPMIDSEGSLTLTE
jgi:2-phospho-L-lactate guanylyltransferase